LIALIFNAHRTTVDSRRRTDIEWRRIELKLNDQLAWTSLRPAGSISIDLRRVMSVIRLWPAWWY
jgi:hypothetical protein